MTTRKAKSMTESVQYSQISFDTVLESLCEARDTLVLFHRAPDADAVGSAFAMRMVLESLGSRAYCVCQDEIPLRLRFLMHGMQESVLPESIPGDLQDVRVISVDTASPSQLGTLFASYGDRVDLMIDHHGVGEPYANYYVRPDAAATGEIMFDIVKQLATEEKLQITPALCTNLYAAISADTGGFRYSNVTPETHLRAAELLESGIDTARINHLLFSSRTMEELRAQAAAISNLQTHREGKVAIVTCPYALKVVLGLRDQHLDGLVETARSLMGVEVALSIRQPNAEGIFRVSMRSASDFDVSAVCAKFGGGGHKKAAGCTLVAADMDDAIQKLLAELQLIAD